MKINQRLVTVGCSFTFYKWRTWADFLSKHFADYKNYGIPGTDNSTIARIITNLTEPDDVVVAMWSGYERRISNHTYYDTYGFSENHNGCFFVNDKVYYTNYYNQYERFLSTLDNIQWAHTDSMYRQYALHNFSAFPFTNGELDSAPTADMLSLINERSFYIDNVTTPDEYTFTRKFINNNEDTHPTPEAHYEFYKQIICPTLNLIPIEYEN